MEINMKYFYSELLSFYKYIFSLDFVTIPEKFFIFAAKYRFNYKKGILCLCRVWY